MSSFRLKPLFLLFLLLSVTVVHVRAGDVKLASRSSNDDDLITPRYQSSTTSPLVDPDNIVEFVTEDDTPLLTGTQEGSPFQRLYEEKPMEFDQYGRAVSDTAASLGSPTAKSRLGKALQLPNETSCKTLVDEFAVERRKTKMISSRLSALRNLKQSPHSYSYIPIALKEEPLSRSSPPAKTDAKSPAVETRKVVSTDSSPTDAVTVQFDQASLKKLLHLLGSIPTTTPADTYESSSPLHSPDYDGDTEEDVEDGDGESEDELGGRALNNYSSLDFFSSSRSRSRSRPRHHSRRSKQGVPSQRDRQLDMLTYLLKAFKKNPQSTLETTKVFSEIAHGLDDLEKTRHRGSRERSFSPSVDENFQNTEKCTTYVCANSLAPQVYQHYSLQGNHHQPYGQYKPMRKLEDDVSAGVSSLYGFPSGYQHQPYQAYDPLPVKREPLKSSLTGIGGGGGGGGVDSHLSPQITIKKEPLSPPKPLPVPLTKAVLRTFELKSSPTSRTPLPLQPFKFDTSPAKSPSQDAQLTKFIKTPSTPEKKSISQLKPLPTKRRLNFDSLPIVSATKGADAVDDATQDSREDNVLGKESQTSSTVEAGSPSGGNKGSPMGPSRSKIKTHRDMEVRLLDTLEDIETGADLKQCNDEALALIDASPKHHTLDDSRLLLLISKLDDYFGNRRRRPHPPRCACSQHLGKRERRKEQKETQTEMEKKKKKTKTKTKTSLSVDNITRFGQDDYLGEEKKEGEDDLETEIRQTTDKSKDDPVEPVNVKLFRENTQEDFGELIIEMIPKEEDECLKGEIDSSLGDDKDPIIKDDDAQNDPFKVDGPGQTKHGKQHQPSIETKPSPKKKLDTAKKNEQSKEPTYSTGPFPRRKRLSKRSEGSSSPSTRIVKSKKEKKGETKTIDVPNNGDIDSVTTKKPKKNVTGTLGAKKTVGPENIPRPPKDAEVDAKMSSPSTPIVNVPLPPSPPPTGSRPTPPPHQSSPPAPPVPTTRIIVFLLAFLGLSIIGFYVGLVIVCRNIHMGTTPPSATTATDGDHSNGSVNPSLSGNTSPAAQHRPSVTAIGYF